MTTMNKMEPGEIIKRVKNDYVYKVKELLGAGGYGCVYKVQQAREDGTILSNSKLFAMKTEMANAAKHSSRLKIEKLVMSEYGKADAQYREHFPELIEHGMTPNFKWIVMSLVGCSLECLKKNGFSMSTALQCGLQTLKAIRDFHLIGFLHRDIKPGNFCAGFESKNDIIYMLDFGLARKYKKKDGTLRPPRPRTKMVGTPRYCSRASHLKQDLARKDDYESWFFMLLDFIDVERGIQWRGKPREQAFELKQKLFDDPAYVATVSPLIPPSFNVMTLYLNELDYNSDVEFGIFRETITDFARTLKITLKEPLDWTTQAATAPKPQISVSRIQNIKSGLGEKSKNNTQSRDDSMHTEDDYDSSMERRATLTKSKMSNTKRCLILKRRSHRVYRQPIRDETFHTNLTSTSYFQSVDSRAQKSPSAQDGEHDDSPNQQHPLDDDGDDNHIQYFCSTSFIIKISLSNTQNGEIEFEE
ncbi:unnamed protein product [Caenorhabditis bovis]|uniref:Protein kinase domain-containing protein n=1 Tax=Caenorhabditis bovis TaxID=2654633 RepID=A0A8S1EQV4_9PELO|nr:unnamed protein product [Caenorhabditis bovis]